MKNLLKMSREIAKHCKRGGLKPSQRMAGPVIEAYNGPLADKPQRIRKGFYFPGNGKRIQRNENNLARLVR